jgi:hypothetical protein
MSGVLPIVRNSASVSAEGRSEVLPIVSAEKAGGDEGIRTPDLLVANEALYQLSYIPSRFVRASPFQKYTAESRRQRFSNLARPLLNTNSMKQNSSKSTRKSAPTLAELISTVNQLTRDEQLGAYIVADLINSRKVRLEGEFQGHRVLVD